MRPSTTACSANSIVPPAAPRMVLCEYAEKERVYSSMSFHITNDDFSHSSLQIFARSWVVGEGSTIAPKMLVCLDVFYDMQSDCVGALGHRITAFWRTDVTLKACRSTISRDNGLSYRGFQQKPGVHLSRATRWHSMSSSSCAGIDRGSILSVPKT